MDEQKKAKWIEELLMQIELLQDVQNIKENTDIVYFNNFWTHIVLKQMEEIDKRYFKKIPSEIDTYLEIREKFEGKNVIPFADFCITTVCTLQCRDCSLWIPYIKEKKHLAAEKIFQDLENIFQYVDYIHILSPLGGELFLHPQIGEILEHLSMLARKGKIGYIRIVTNGTILPDEKTIKALCDENIYILISNYENVLTEIQSENLHHLIQLLEKYGGKYYYMEPMKWINLGIPEKKRFSKEQMIQSFNQCFAHNCVGIYDGALYHCPRSYALKCISNEEECEKEEVIYFSQISSKQEIKQKLEDFYHLNYLSACAWCAEIQERKPIPPAIQCWRKTDEK